MSICQEYRKKRLIHPSTYDLNTFYNNMSKNIMTPDRVKVGYKLTGDCIYEVTTGEDRQGDTIYGVTVHYWDTDEKRYEYFHDASTMVYSETELERVINDIPVKFKEKIGGEL